MMSLLKGGRALGGWCRLIALKKAVERRTLFPTVVLPRKLYREGENAHFMSIMESAPGYSLALQAPSNTSEIVSTERFESLISEEADVNTMSASFSLVSEYARANNVDIAEERLDSYVDRLADSFREMNDEQLERALIDLRKWPEASDVYARNHVELWTALDDVLSRSVPGSNSERLLRFAEHFHRLNLSRKSDYTFLALRKQINRKGGEDPSHFVQTMFYVGAARRKMDDIITMEEKLEKLMDELTMDEIAIVCAGFFKSKSNIKESRLIGKLMDRLIAEAPTISSISLCAVLKLLKFSLRIGHADQTMRLLDTLVAQIPRVSLMCCTQIAILPTPISLHHEISLEKVQQKFLEDPASARIKDLERLTFAASLFTQKGSEEFYDAVVEQLRSPIRGEEIALHGRCFLSCLHYLTIANVYPEDLIDRALQERFIKKAYGSMPTLRRDRVRTWLEAAALSASVDIERPRYAGAKLHEKYVKLVAKNCTDYVPNGLFPMDVTERTIFEVICAFEKARGGKEFVHCDHILPHFNRGVLIFCDDADGNPVDISGVFPKEQFGTVRRIPNENHTWYSVIFSGKYNYVLNTRELIGLAKMKERQTAKLGYRPIIVSLTYWVKVEHKLSYIRNCMKMYPEATWINRTGRKKTAAM